jgi:tetratricopeptide (TPR) repeat protein
MGEAALARIRGMVSENPAYRKLRRFAGRIRRRIKRQQEPGVITVQLSASDPAAALFKKAQALSANGQHEQAIEVLDGILRARPTELVILQTKGQLLTALQRYSDAVMVFERALKSDPNNLVSLESLARLHEALNGPDEALSLWRKIALLNGCDENIARKIGAQIWDRDERARNSSFFKDVEEGVPPIESLVAETDAVLKADTEADGKALLDALEKLSRQIAGQNSVLGRLDTMYTYYEYTLMQGRFRSMALHRYNKTPFGDPETPPASIPAAMLPAFSMNGRVEIQSGYINSSLPAECTDGFDDEAIKSFLSYNLNGLPQGARFKATEIVAGFEPVQHSQAKRTFLRTKDPAQHYELKIEAPIEFYKFEPTGTVAIVGEADRYFECLLVAMCKRLTLVRYGKVSSGAALFDQISIADWMSDPQEYDVIICRRSLEHWGLGRYGEPLDPDGDVRLIKKFREKLQPGGSLFLEIPVGRDRLIFNSTRIFGKHRLPLLLDGWRHKERDPSTPLQLAARVPARLKFHLHDATA